MSSYARAIYCEHASAPGCHRTPVPVISPNKASTRGSLFAIFWQKPGTSAVERIEAFAVKKCTGDALWQHPTNGIPRSRFRSVTSMATVL